MHTIREHGRSGGVSLYCRLGLSIEIIVELTLCTESIESCVVEIGTGTEGFVIFAIYRPHSDCIQNFSNILDELLHSPRLNNRSIVLLCDLNVNLLKYHKQNVNTFMGLMQANSFIPLTTKATIFPTERENCVPSLLDHIWVNSFVQFSSGIITTDLTDH